MVDTTQIRSGQIVYVHAEAQTGGRPGQPVGTVDHMDGEDFIKLTREDSPDGKHHWVAVDQVAKIEPDTVYLKCTRDDFIHILHDAPEPRRSETFKTQGSPHGDTSEGVA